MIKVGLAISIFLIMGALLIVSNHNLHLIKPDELDKFGRLYYNWVSSIFQNIKTITGQVTLENWAPEKPGKSKDLSKNE